MKEILKICTKTKTHQQENKAFDRVGILDCDVSNCSWENPFGFGSVDEHSLVEEFSIWAFQPLLKMTLRFEMLQMKNSLRYTVYINTPKSKQIFPTTYKACRQL